MPLLRLRKISVYSKRSYTRTVPIRRRNWSRKATTAASTELDGLVRECVAFCCAAATQAKWHGFQPIYIANTPYAVRCLQRTSDCYEVNRVSVSPRGANAVGSLSRGERRYGRDALSNTSCECVVAKANEADCFANAEVQTCEEGGKLHLRFHNVRLYKKRTNLLTKKVYLFDKQTFIYGVCFLLLEYEKNRCYFGKRRCGKNHRYGDAWTKTCACRI